MRRMIRLPIFIALMVGLSGCVQPNMSDSTRTKAEGTGVGILGGALIGAAIGGRQGAAWGAAIGGSIGYLFGSHVAEEKEKYARKEDWLNACISSARKVNKSTRAYNSKLSKEIKKTKKLVRLYKKNKISKSQLRAQKRVIDKERRTANNMLEKSQKELAAQKRVLREARKMGKKSYANRLSREISRLKKENRALKRKTKTLASLSALTAV